MHAHSTMSKALVRPHCVANADQSMSCQQRVLQKPSVNTKSPLRAPGKATETAIDLKGGGDGTNKTILSPDGHQTEQTWMI